MNKTIITIIVIVIIAFGGYFLFSGQYSPEDQSQATEQSQLLNQEVGNESSLLPSETSAPSSASETQSENIVRYTVSGYTSSTLTIKVGETVTYKNESGESMWTASAVHPTHTAYDQTSRSQHCPDTTGTAFDQCSSGNEFRFTFTKAGAWKYHNHLNASHTGTIVVE
ncbi:MAG: hypothetical protein Q8Q18_01110 [bacterium]|nr:hypothetical protein [bacterium]